MTRPTPEELAYYGPDDEGPDLGALAKSLGATLGAWTLLDLIKAMVQVKAHRMTTKTGKVVNVQASTQNRADAHTIVAGLAKKLKGAGKQVYVHGTGVVNHEGKTTAEKYGHAGPDDARDRHDVTRAPNHRYSSERHQLHKTLVKNTVSHVKSSRKPIAVLTAGGTASGKSSIMGHLKATHPHEPDEMAHIDADTLKHGLPDYQAMSNHEDDDVANGAAWHAHQESAHLVGAAIAHCINHKKSFLYDSTSSDKHHTARMIQQLKDAGYEVHMHYADLPVDQALDREEQRYREKRRRVPKEVVERTHKGATETLGHVHHMLDSVHVYDSDVPRDTPAKKVYERSATKRFRDEAHLERMAKRGHSFMDHPNA